MRAHLRRVRDCLLAAAGALATLYVLSLSGPWLLFGSVATFPLALMVVLLGPGVYALYLAFMPQWRRVPMGLRRPAIAGGLSLSLLCVALLALHGVLEGRANAVFLFVVMVGGVLALYG